MVTVTVRIPEPLLKRVQAITGQQDAASAVRRALEIATRDYALNAAARRALEPGSQLCQGAGIWECLTSGVAGFW